MIDVEKELADYESWKRRFLDAMQRYDKSVGTKRYDEILALIKQGKIAEAQRLILDDLAKEKKPENDVEDYWGE